MMARNNLVLSEEAKKMMRMLKFNLDDWKKTRKEFENKGKLEQTETINEIIDYLEKWTEINKGCPVLHFHPEIERYINNEENDYFKYIMISLLTLFLFVWLISR